MERAQHTDEPEYEPPIVEELETDGEGATVSVCGMFGGSGVAPALTEPTDNPAAAGEV